MNVKQIQVSLQDFRAIKDANIILDGITVVAGENGSGKSSLSKFLYNVLKIANEYDEFLDIKLKQDLRNYHRFIEEFAREVDYLYNIT